MGGLDGKSNLMEGAIVLVQNSDGNFISKSD
jgi:hypothetical protein